MNATDVRVGSLQVRRMVNGAKRPNSIIVE